MISIPGHEAATAALTSAKTACKASTEKLNLGVNVSSSTPSTDADADSETIRQLDPCTPTSGRDRRVEKTRELLLKFEEQKKKWQGHRPFQQLQNRNMPRQDVAPGLNNAKSPTERRPLSSKDSTTRRISMTPAAVTSKHLESNESYESPTGVEDTEQVNCGNSDNSDRGAVTCNKQEKKLMECDCGNKNNVRGAVTFNESEQKLMEYNNLRSAYQKQKDSLDGFPAVLDNVNCKSTDSTESTGTSLSEISFSHMKGVQETQPLRGAKYYIMVNTKRGQAKIVHEAMPATGREGFNMAMEEKGYEIIEYRMPGGDNGPSAATVPPCSALTREASIAESTQTSLSILSDSKMKKVKETQPLGGPKYYIMTNTKKGQARIVHEAMPSTGREGFNMAMEEKGYEIMEYDLLTPRGEKIPPGFFSPRGEKGSVPLPTSPPADMEQHTKSSSKPIQHAPKKTNASYTRHNSLQSWLDGLDSEFNKVLDVADKIDGAITSCGNIDALDYNGTTTYSTSDEESSYEDIRDKNNSRRKSFGDLQGRRPNHVVSARPSSSSRQGRRGSISRQRRS